MSRNLSVLDALVNISSHTTSCLPYKTRSNLNVDEAASSVAGVFFLLEGVYDAVCHARPLIDYHMWLLHGQDKIWTAECGLRTADWV